MLKNIPAGFTPELLWTLAAMGHGDRLAIVDANYPAQSVHRRLVRLSGVDTIQAAALVTALMPIDAFIAPAAHWMTPDGDPDAVFEVHAAFRDAVRAGEGSEVPFGGLERTAFYAEAKGAFAAVATSDVRPYACFLLTKGVVSSAGPGERDMPTGRSN